MEWESEDVQLPETGVCTPFFDNHLFGRAKRRIRCTANFLPLALVSQLPIHCPQKRALTELVLDVSAFYYPNFKKRDYKICR